jgi:hypothetical protein
VVVGGRVVVVVERGGEVAGTVVGVELLPETDAGGGAVVDVDVAGVVVVGGEDVDVTGD